MTNAVSMPSRPLKSIPRLKAWRGVALNYELLNRCDLEQGLYEDAKKNLDTGMPYAIQTQRELCIVTVLCRIWKTPCHS